MNHGMIQTSLFNWDDIQPIKEMKMTEQIENKSPSMSDAEIKAFLSAQEKLKEEEAKIAEQRAKQEAEFATKKAELEETAKKYRAIQIAELKSKIEALGVDPKELFSTYLIKKAAGLVEGEKKKETRGRKPGTKLTPKAPVEAPAKTKPVVKKTVAKKPAAKKPAVKKAVKKLPKKTD